MSECVIGRLDVWVSSRHTAVDLFLVRSIRSHVALRVCVCTVCAWERRREGGREGVREGGREGGREGERE